MIAVALGCGAVGLASFLGGVVGFAYGLVALPLLLLLGFPLPQVVVANLTIAFFSRWIIIWRRWNDIDRSRVTRMLSGVLPGTILGLLVVRYVNESALRIVAGILVLSSVIALLFRNQLQRRSPEGVGSRGLAKRQSHEQKTMEYIAGTLGALLGATTSLNGIPSAILLTGRKVRARTLVGDMAVYFVGGNVITAIVLIAGNRFPISTIWPELVVWVVAGLVGTGIGLRLGPRLSVTFFHKLSMTLITVSGFAAVVTAVL